MLVEADDDVDRFSVLVLDPVAFGAEDIGTAGDDEMRGVPGGGQVIGRLDRQVLGTAYGQGLDDLGFRAARFAK